MAHRTAQPISLEDHDNVLNQLQDVTNVLEGHTVHLTKDERIELLPARKGFEDFLYRLISIAKEKGMNLENYPRDLIEQEVKSEAMLRDIVDKVSELYNAVQDTYRATRNNVWEAFLAYYKLSTAYAEVDAAVAARLKPIIDFMSNAASKKKNDETDNVKGTLD